MRARGLPATSMDVGSKRSTTSSPTFSPTWSSSGEVETRPPSRRSCSPRVTSKGWSRTTTSGIGAGDVEPRVGLAALRVVTPEDPLLGPRGRRSPPARATSPCQSDLAASAMALSASCHQRHGGPPASDTAPPLGPGRLLGKHAGSAPSPARRADPTSDAGNWEAPTPPSGRPRSKLAREAGRRAQQRRQRVALAETSRYYPA